VSVAAAPQHATADKGRGADGASPLLQRKCACGKPIDPLTGECAECRNKRLQKELAVGATNDPLEHDADRVADEVMAAPAAGAHPQVQRDGGRAGEGAAPAPPSVDRALATAGRPLEPALRQDMEGRFGHDFGRVRVHASGAAERSAQDLDANAYTVGHDIVFGAGQFAPGSPGGRRLLAHELAHVVQQGSAAPVLRAQPKKPPAKKAPAKKAPAKPKTPQICGRDSRKVKDNWITKVNLDVGSNDLTIEWDDPKKAPAMSAGTHNISPGTGKCCVDCNDETTSQTGGSLCTPKGGTWKVSTTGCELGGHPTAKNPTYFQRSGVAIHSGNTSSPPRSHGCARTSVAISELIHDNVKAKKTDIAVTGTWKSSKCFMKEADETPVNRKDVCDGNKLKSKKKEKKKEEKKKDTKKAKPKAGGGGGTPKDKPVEKVPVAAAEEPFAGEEELAALEGLEPEGEGFADGPGPNNDPATEEALAEIPLADLDLEVAEIGAEEEGGGEAAV